VQSLSEIKSLLASRNLAPRKSLGQNFLIDHNLIRKLVDAAAAGPGDLVLEIGPGTGALTDELLARGCTVIACELDRGLVELLRERLAAPIASGRLTLIEADCLGPGRTLAPEVTQALAAASPPPNPKSKIQNPKSPFALISNLPYNAATPVMLALLMDHPECRALFVTIQREVADRILARPGTKDYGTLGIVAQAVATPSRIASLPPECFWPRPDVASTMLGLTRRADPATSNPRALAEFCQRLFSARRKQLGGTLKGEPGLAVGWPEGILPTMRAEELTVDQIVMLGQAVSEPAPR
jgi:16S rRNA (adenine1518-N6/adenine1519-N6)-dimethyltransferase